MHEHIELLFYKLRYLTYALLLIAGFLAAAFIFSTDTAQSKSVTEERSSSFLSSLPATDNVVTNAFFSAAASVERTISSTEDRLSGGVSRLAATFTRIDEIAGNGSRAALRNLHNSMQAASRLLSSGITAAGNGAAAGLAVAAEASGTALAIAANAPVNLLGAVANTSVVTSITRPTVHAQLPAISSPYEPLAHQQPAAIPAAAASITPPPDTAAAWPMRGNITTRFGVPHWPFQPRHSGLDISDGRPAGTTPIKPYKPGRVVRTVRSFQGLGNHVIVDHGAGITSVYAHLSSVTVHEGQIVDKSTTLGYAGSTGASTGTHLHLEIRVNGRPVDPLPYLNG